MLPKFSNESKNQFCSFECELLSCKFGGSYSFDLSMFQARLTGLVKNESPTIEPGRIWKRFNRTETHFVRVNRHVRSHFCTKSQLTFECRHAHSLVFSLASVFFNLNHFRYVLVLVG
jgi:hypothetical protein